MEKINKTEAIKIAEKLWKSESNPELKDDAKKLLMHFGPAIKKEPENVFQWLDIMTAKKDIRVWMESINVVGNETFATNGFAGAITDAIHGLDDGQYILNAAKDGFDKVENTGINLPDIKLTFKDYKSFDYKELKPVFAYKNGLFLVVIKDIDDQEHYFDYKRFNDFHCNMGCIMGGLLRLKRVDGYGVLMPMRID